MAIQKVTKTATFLLAARSAEKLARFVLVALLARGLAVEYFGAYSVALYFTSFCLIAFDWGLQTYVLRQIAGAPDAGASLYRAGIRLKLIYTGLGVALVACALVLLRYPALIVRAIVLVLAGRILSSFSQYMEALFRARGVAVYEALTSILGSAVLIGGTIACLFLHAGIPMMAAMWVVAGFCELSLATVLVRRRVMAGMPAGSVPALRTLAWSALPFGITTVSTMIYYYMDTIILSKMDVLASVSRYTAAYNLVFAVITIPQVVVDSAFPLLSYYYLGQGMTGAAAVSRLVRYFIIITVPLGLGTTLLSRNIIQFLYGASYLSPGSTAGADRVLAVLIWNACTIFFTYLFGTVLSAVQHERFVTKIAIAGAVVNTVLNVVLIPRFSIMGAAWATLITEGAILFCLRARLRRVMTLDNMWPLAGQVLIAASVMSLVVAGARQFVPVLVDVALGAVSYGLVLTLLGTIGQEDLGLIRSRL